MDRLKIICDGDSWVFGSEILDPNAKKHGFVDYESENDEYRIPRIFPTYLGELMGADVINLAWPSDDNGTILHRIMTYLSSNYISKGISTDNILVIVGWSSPERNFFWYKDGKMEHRFRIWPQDNHTNTIYQKQIWDLYVEFLWNPEEYLPRYVMNVLQFQNFCEVNKIKWLCFNSFYQSPNLDPVQWRDMNTLEDLKKIHIHKSPFSKSGENGRLYHDFNYVSLWETVNNVNFYKKNELKNTFKSFMEKAVPENPYCGWHPSPESHYAWAKELKRYIEEHNIFNNE